MDRKHIAPFLLAFVALLIVPSARGQDRINDNIMVTLPDGVQVGDHPLKAGDYKVKQIPSANNPRILQFIDKEGKTVEATVAAIPALNNTGAESTVLELKRAGGRQYVSKLWIEGKAYGYELPTPSADAGPVSSASLKGSFTPTPVEVAAAPAPRPEPEPE